MGLQNLNLGHLTFRSILLPRCVDMNPHNLFELNQKFSQVFGVFMPFACVFNCCRQQTIIPLKLPCVHVCVSLFFWEVLGGGVLENAGLRCVFMCVCVYV